MKLFKLFKTKYNSMFYGDTVEVLSGIRQTLNDCSGILSKTSLDNYSNNFQLCGDSFEHVVEIIDSFLSSWESDEYNVCNTLKSIKEYIEYYIRLCDSSSPSNYNINRKYMIESIETVSLTIGSKLRYLVKSYKESN